MNLGLLANAVLYRIVKAYEDRQMRTLPLTNEQPNVHREVSCFIAPFQRDQEVLHDVVGPMAAALANDLIARDVRYFLVPDITGLQNVHVVTDARTGISLRARSHYDQGRAQETMAVDVWGWTPRASRQPPPLPEPRIEIPREFQIVTVTTRAIELID